MTAEEITIRVTPEAAHTYRSATEQERRKLNLILSLHLTDAMRSNRSLEQIMDDMSRKAKERGLTPQILESILNEE